jgi:hypothetical protein|tara:strand:+ start:230 stop:508 length:279 start_codon:yes stop_codon:yes gene_type:complete
MVISKPIRPKKKTIPNYINVDTTPIRITTRDKVIISLKKNKTGMSLIAIGEDADIPSQGNLHTVMKRMLRRKEVTLTPCTHCGRTEIYKLSI